MTISLIDFYFIKNFKIYLKKLMLNFSIVPKNIKLYLQRLLNYFHFSTLYLCETTYLLPTNQNNMSHQSKVEAPT